MWGAWGLPHTGGFGTHYPHCAAGEAWPTEEQRHWKGCFRRSPGAFTAQPFLPGFLAHTCWPQHKNGTAADSSPGITLTLVAALGRCPTHVCDSDGQGHLWTFSPLSHSRAWNGASKQDTWIYHLEQKVWLQRIGATRGHPSAAWKGQICMTFSIPFLLESVRIWQV